MEERKGGRFKIDIGRMLCCFLAIIVVGGVPLFRYGGAAGLTVFLALVVLGFAGVMCAFIWQACTTGTPASPAAGSTAEPKGIPISGSIGRLVVTDTTTGTDSLTMEGTGVAIPIQPHPIARDELARRIGSLSCETTVYRADEISPDLMLIRVKRVFQRAGFQIITNDRRVMEGGVEGLIEGWGLLLRTGQAAAAMMSVSGSPYVSGCRCTLSVYCADESLTEPLHHQLFGRIVYGLITSEPVAPTSSPKRTPQPMPQASKPITTDYAEQTVTLERRADFLEEAVRLVVEVANRSAQPITNVSVQVSSYPTSAMSLRSEEMQTNYLVEPSASWAAEFDFEPKTDCIQDEISVHATYVGADEKPHRLATPALSIRTVCGLFVAEAIDDRELEQRLAGMENGEITISIENMNSREMYLKALGALKQLNFHEVSSGVKESDGFVMGEVNGWARGKYTRRGVGLSMVVYGSGQGIGCSCRIIVSAEDDRVILPAIQEVRHMLEI